MTDLSDNRSWRRVGGLGLILLAAATSLKSSVLQSSSALRNRVSLIQTSVPEPRKPSRLERLISFEVKFEMNTGDSGLLVIGGDELETFALFVESGRVVGTYQNIFQDKAFRIESEVLPLGVVNARFDLGPEETPALSRQRKGTLFVNGRCMGQTPPIEYSLALSVPNSLVGTEQSLENLLPKQTYTGKIRKVVPLWRVAP